MCVTLCCCVVCYCLLYCGVVRVSVTLYTVVLLCDRMLFIVTCGCSCWWTVFYCVLLQCAMLCCVVPHCCDICLLCCYTLHCCGGCCCVLSHVHIKQPATSHNHTTRHTHTHITDSQQITKHRLYCNTHHHPTPHAKHTPTHHDTYHTS